MLLVTCVGLWREWCQVCGCAHAPRKRALGGCVNAISESRITGMAAAECAATAERWIRARGSTCKIDVVCNSAEGHDGEHYDESFHFEWVDDEEAARVTATGPAGWRWPRLGGYYGHLRA